MDQGLRSEETLPGGLNVSRRARALWSGFQADPESVFVPEWLCAYAMVVNEKNAAGHMVVTAPTNGASGVVAAVLRYIVDHEEGSKMDIHTFLLTAASLAMRGTGDHFMPLDACIEAMRKTGLEMSHKYKETSLGGLTVSVTEC